MPIHLERDNSAGCVYIKDEFCTLAQTKSVNVARRIRDALNAHDGLVGQAVETVDKLEGKRVGVIVAVDYDQKHSMFALLVRMDDDNEFETFNAGIVRIVEPIYDPKTDGLEP